MTSNSSLAPQTNKINHLDPEGDFNPPIEICYNTHWHGKPPKGDHALGEYKWQHRTATVRQVMDAVAKGQAFTSALGDAIHVSASGKSRGIHRDASNFVSLQLACVDFDAGTSFEDVLDDSLARDSGAFLYETFSHTPEAPRCRIGFALEHPITEPERATELLFALIYHFGAQIPDTGTHDCVRVWYGTRPGNRTYWIGGMLTMSQVDALIAEWRAAGGHAVTARTAGPPDAVAVADSVAGVIRNLDARNLAHGEPEAYQGGARIKLAKCPINPTDNPHKEDGSAVVFVGADGTRRVHCPHDTCQRLLEAAERRGWAMLKEKNPIVAPAAHVNGNGASEVPEPPEDDGYIPAEPPAAVDAPLAVKARGKPKGEKVKRTGQAAELQTILQSMGYTFRLNEVSEQLEANGRPLHSGERADILTRLYDAGITNRTMSDDVIEAIAWRNRYHPVRDYLNGLTWDGTPRIIALGRHLRTDDPEINYQRDGAHLPVPAVWLYRWMIGAVARTLDDGLRRPDVPVLVWSGAQSIGKSSLAQWIASPLEEYFREGAINPESTEHQRALCETWIWEVGELGLTTRRADVEALKHFLTQDGATYRIPYAKHPVRKKAMSCIISTINPDGAGFLSDTTGNRRFLVANVKSIDWRYRELPIDQLWAEAVAIWRKTPNAWQLDPEEIKRRDGTNTEHMQTDWVSDAIQQLFTITPRDATGPVMTVHDIVRVLQEHGGKGYAPKALQMQTAATLGALEVVRLANARPRAYAGIEPKPGVYVPESGAAGM